MWNLHGRWFACLPQSVHVLKVLVFLPPGQSVPEPEGMTYKKKKMSFA